MSPAPVAYVDVETTGLDAARHQIWEVGLIVDGDEHVWQFQIDESKADPFALEVGRYWERRWTTWSLDGGLPSERDAIYQAHTQTSRHSQRPEIGMAIKPRQQWCQHFQGLTAGRHLVGAVVSFDEERLRRLMLTHHVLPRWHYHLVDVKALVAGFLGCEDVADDGTRLGRWTPPWDSMKLSRAVGVDPGAFEQHTALGDARWAKALYEAVMGDKPA